MLRPGPGEPGILGVPNDGVPNAGVPGIDVPGIGELNDGIEMVVPAAPHDHGWLIAFGL